MLQSSYIILHIHQQLFTKMNYTSLFFLIAEYYPIVRL